MTMQTCGVCSGAKSVHRRRSVLLALAAPVDLARASRSHRLHHSRQVLLLGRHHHHQPHSHHRRQKRAPHTLRLTRCILAAKPKYARCDVLLRIATSVDARRATSVEGRSHWRRRSPSHSRLWRCLPQALCRWVRRHRRICRWLCSCLRQPHYRRPAALHRHLTTPHFPQRASAAVCRCPASSLAPR
jgi:hypothetical protein